MTDSQENDGGIPASRRNKVGLVLGLAVFAIIEIAPAPSGLSSAGWHTAAIALLVAIWWVTEAIPLSATALLPLVLFPLLDVTTVGDAAVPYANRVIFLMVGGFVIALGMQRWNLHRRIALSLVALTGGSPAGVIGGFMLAAAVISMWVFNTTTTVMMLPIALSVIEFVRGGTADCPEHTQATKNFATALMIGIAYAATIGGMGTLIGTAPNAVLAGFMTETYGIDVSFVEWMMVGVPMVILMLPVVWLILTKIAFPIDLPPVPGQAQMIRDELTAMGPMSRGERTVAAVVAVTAVLWIFRPLINEAQPFFTLNDTSVALLAAVALFIIPVDLAKGTFALGGEWARKIPWGVVILFGGGLSLAAGIKSSGLADWIGDATGGLLGLETIAVVFIVVILMILLTEITSNTATTATFLPILGATATAINVDPLLLIVPATLAASCAFMMPVATPPNAIVFGSGEITIPQMVRAGLWLNLIGLVLIVFWVYVAGGLIGL